MGPQDVLVDPEYMNGFSVDVILISDYNVNQILLTLTVNTDIYQVVHQ